MNNLLRIANDPGAIMRTFQLLTCIAFPLLLMSCSPLPVITVDPARDAVDFDLHFGLPPTLIDKSQEEQLEHKQLCCLQSFRLLTGMDTPCAFTVTARTDSAEYEFMPYLSGVRTHDSVRYVHGSLPGAYGHPSEYKAIPFSHIRELSLDQSLVISFNGNSRVYLPRGEWRIILSGDRLDYILYSDVEGGTYRTIPVNHITSILPPNPDATLEAAGGLLKGVIILGYITQFSFSLLGAIVGAGG